MGSPEREGGLPTMWKARSSEEYNINFGEKRKVLEHIHLGYRRIVNPCADLVYIL